MSPRRRVMYAAAVAAAMVLALTAQAWAVDPARASQQMGGTQKLWVFFTDKGLT